MNDQRFRVTNKCKYDIGVTLSNNRDILIKAGSFQLLTSDDIVYIESICMENKFFSKRMLVVYDQTGKEVDLSQLGAYIENDPNPHLDDAEIQTMLKSSANKIKAWLEPIEDPSELHGIAEVAKTMELTSSKLKILQEKMPDVNFFENKE